MNFKVVEDLEEEMKPDNEVLQERGYFVLDRDDDSVLLVISSGEKPSGGHEIDVTDAEEEDGIVKVTVKETEPAEGDIVTDAITYPYVVVKLETTATEFVVADEDGEEFPCLDEETEEAEVVEAEGTFVGAAEDNTIEIQLDGEEEPKVFVTEELEGFEAPEEDAKVAISYYSNEEGQNILVTFEVAE